MIYFLPIFSLLPLYQVGQLSAISEDDQVAPSFTDTLSPVTLTTGDRLALRCNVVGTPDPTVEWYKDSKNLRDIDRCTIKNRAGMCSLTLPDVTSSDSGEYSCKARNEAGETSIKTTVIVKDKMAESMVKTQNELPYFIQLPQGQILTDGDSTIIECDVRGSTEVIWYKNNEIVMENEDFKLEKNGDKYRLLITEVYPEDSGTYRAEACNATGSTSSYFTLYVNVPDEEPTGPCFQEYPRSQNVVEGAPVTFTCVVDSLDSVTWMKDTRVLDDTGRFKLTQTLSTSSFTIPAALVTDTGIYHVEVNNEKGNTVWTFTLNVETSGSPCADIDVLRLIQQTQ